MKKVKKYGFTLAEILIVLTIIGVMAVMTIPSLIQNSNSQQKLTLFKKAFNAASNAYATEFAVKTPPSKIGVPERQMVFDALKKQLNVKYYYNFETQKKEYEPTKEYSYGKYIIVTEDGIGYGTGGCSASTGVKSKTEVNGVKTSSHDACLLTGMIVKAYLEPTKITTENIDSDKVVCSDDADLGKLKCSKTYFFVTKQGLTAGNPDCIFAGRVMSDNMTYDKTKCEESAP